MTLLALSKCGYGSFLELSKLDTPEILDMIEYESIIADIQAYEINQK